MKIDKNVWTDAKCAAFRVEFLTSREELFLYAKAIYPLWGGGDEWSCAWFSFLILQIYSFS